MQISYHIFEGEYEKLRTADYNKMSASRLSYHYTYGTVTYQCDLPNSESLTFYTPVVDHALALRWVVNRLEEVEVEDLHFTEKESVITFAHSNAGVLITSDWRDWSCLCPFEELQTLSEKLLQDVIADVCAAVPQMCKFLIGPDRII